MSYLELNIKDAKRKLYFYLLKKNPDEYSDIEIELLFQLSKDDAIQSVLRDNLRKDNNE